MWCGLRIVREKEKCDTPTSVSISFIFSRRPMMIEAYKAKQCAFKISDCGALFEAEDCFCVNLSKLPVWINLLKSRTAVELLIP